MAGSSDLWFEMHNVLDGEAGNRNYKKTHSTREIWIQFHVLAIYECSYKGGGTTLFGENDRKLTGKLKGSKKSETV